MKKYKLIIAYDGTRFSGWQVQPNGISIQETLEKAMEILFQEKILITGSGRTDAGVHAYNQVAHFSIDREIDCRRVRHALNGILPETIQVLGILETDLKFHAQHSAKGKCYIYYLNLRSVRSPFIRVYSWHISRPLDISAMKEASRYLLGTHNFTSFSNQSHLGACKNDPVRTLKRIDFIEWEEGIKLVFEGDGFLYKMVRNIVGTLVEVGKNKYRAQDVKRILEAKDRKEAGHAAPPQGLFLNYVTY